VGAAGHRRSVARLRSEGRLSPSAPLDDALAGIAASDDDLSAFDAIDADGARRAPARYLRFAHTRRGPGTGAP